MTTSSSPPALNRSHASPNHGPRQPVDGRVGIRHLVLHYTGMRTGADALARLCDPAAQVSAHYLIEEDGRVFALVDEQNRAWHAGVAFWGGVRDINSTSIGIELVNPGDEFGYRPFPDAQIAALLALGRDIVARHAIAARDILGHSDVAPGRKQDPGAFFPWATLAAEGLGIWPARLEPAAVTALWPLFSTIGYAVPDGPGGDILAPETAARDVISAFQQRYRPAQVDGIADAETAARLSAVATVAARTAA